MRRGNGALDQITSAFPHFIQSGAGAPHSKGITQPNFGVRRWNGTLGEITSALLHFIQSGAGAPHSKGITQSNFEVHTKFDFPTAHRIRYDLHMSTNDPIQSVAKAPHAKVPWPHAPTHRLSDGGVFMVTAGTYRKEPFFKNEERLQGLHNGLLKYAKQHRWRLEAWAVFANHYHFIGHSPESATDGAESLRDFISQLHTKSAEWINALDDEIGRKIWHNFWETRLTYEHSYLARLNYVHQNAVKHGLVPVANQYRWCSAAWFERTATPAQVNTVYSFKTNRLNVLDDF